MQTQKSLDEFRNEPFTDFSMAENAEAMRAAIEQVRSELGREYPIVINGEKIALEEKFESYQSGGKIASCRRFFAKAIMMRKILSNRAIDSATEAFKIWRNCSG